MKSNQKVYFLYSKNLLNSLNIFLFKPISLTQIKHEN